MMNKRGDIKMNFEQLPEKMGRIEAIVQGSDPVSFQILQSVLNGEKEAHVLLGRQLTRDEQEELNEQDIEVIETEPCHYSFYWNY